MTKKEKNTILQKTLKKNPSLALPKSIDVPTLDEVSKLDEEFSEGEKMLYDWRNEFTQEDSY